MPIGNVKNATAAADFPAGLYRAFVRTEAYAVLGWDMQYADGRNQRSALGPNPRMAWRLARRLTAATMAELYQFYVDRLGPLQAFNFTDPVLQETVKARFASPWEHTLGIGSLTDTSFEIVQVV